MSRGWPLWQRLAATVALLLVPILGERVPLPGLDLGAPVFEFPGMPTANMSAFALGMSPLMSAYFTVEIAALLVPRWRKLRHAFPKGRAPLRRATVILALVLAAFQAYGVTMMMASPEFGALGESLVERLVPWLTLLGATSVLVLAASAIERLGLMNGVLALELVSSVNRSIPTFSGLALPSDPLRVTSIAGACAVPVLVTWVVCSASERSRRSDTPWLSLPVSSVHPLRATLALLALPASLMNLGLPGADVLHDVFDGPWRWEITLALGALVTVLFGFLLQQPPHVAHVVARIDDEASVSPSTVRVALWSSLVPSLLFMGALFGAEELARANRLPLPLATTLALATAVVLDAGAALKLHAKRRGWVQVWEERRPYAATALIAVAAREGLTLRATGLAQTSLLRIFGPYAAIGLWCAPADVEQARQLLGELLEDANTPVPTPTDAPASSPAATPRASSGAWAHSETWLLAALCALPVAITGVTAIAQSRPGPALRARLEIVLVDDDAQPLNPIPRVDEVPAGVSFFMERVFDGLDDYADRHYAYLEPLAGETFDQAAQRVEPWLATLPLPPGARFAWQPEHLSAEAGEKRGREAGRTYVLTGAPIITSRDVKRLEAFLVQPGDAAISLTFTTEAAGRFQRATREHLYQRMAILLDGRIESAPVIRSEIKGGTVQISLGQPDDPAAALSEAEAFVAQLRSGARPRVGSTAP